VHNKSTRRSAPDGARRGALPHGAPSGAPVEGAPVEGAGDTGMGPHTPPEDRMEQAHRSAEAGDRRFRVDTRTQDDAAIVTRLAEACGEMRPNDAVCATLDKRVDIVNHDGRILSASHWIGAWRAFPGVRERRVSAFGDHVRTLRRCAMPAGSLCVGADAASAPTPQRCSTPSSSARPTGARPARTAPAPTTAGTTPRRTCAAPSNRPAGPLHPVDRRAGARRPIHARTHRLQIASRHHTDRCTGRRTGCSFPLHTPPDARRIRRE